MNWDDLKYFLAVARDGQILAASRRLGIGQATLNRRLGALESALGCNLFNRSPTGCTLTGAGRSLLARAERIEAEAARVQASLAPADDDGIVGTVRVGAPDGFGVAYLAGRLGALTQRHPGLTVQLVPVPRSFSLSRREADIAVTVGRPVKGRLRARKLTEYTLGLYATADYLARHPRVNAVADLRDHDLIGSVDDLIYAPQLAFASDLKIPWASRIEISGAVGQYEAVRSGAGIGILHRFMAAQDSALVQIVPDLVIRRSYWTVWHESLNAGRALRVVADYLDEIVGAERHLFR